MLSGEPASWALLNGMRDPDLLVEVALSLPQESMETWLGSTSTVHAPLDQHHVAALEQRFGTDLVAMALQEMDGAYAASLLTDGSTSDRFLPALLSNPGVPLHVIVSFLGHPDQASHLAAVAQCTNRLPLEVVRDHATTLTAAATGSPSAFLDVECSLDPDLADALVEAVALVYCSRPDCDPVELDLLLPLAARCGHEVLAQVVATVHGRNAGGYVVESWFSFADVIIAHLGLDEWCRTAEQFLWALEQGAVSGGRVDLAAAQSVSQLPSAVVDAVLASSHVGPRLQSALLVHADCSPEVIAAALGPSGMAGDWREHAHAWPVLANVHASPSARSRVLASAASGAAVPLPTLAFLAMNPVLTPREQHRVADACRQSTQPGRWSVLARLASRSDLTRPVARLLLEVCARATDPFADSPDEVLDALLTNPHADTARLHVPMAGLAQVGCPQDVSEAAVELLALEWGSDVRRWNTGLILADEWNGTLGELRSAAASLA